MKLTIFLQITSPTDLLSICRSCSALYRLTIPRLYRHIHIRMPFHSVEDIQSLQMDVNQGFLDFTQFTRDCQSSFRPPRKFPSRWELSQHVRHLEISKWEAPLTPNLIVSSESGPNKLWRGHNGTNSVQLWIGSQGGVSPSHPANELLAHWMAESMPNLESFR
jgi:hypothetical protein